MRTYDVLDIFLSGDNLNEVIVERYSARFNRTHTRRYHPTEASKYRLMDTLTDRMWNPYLPNGRPIVTLTFQNFEVNRETGQEISKELFIHYYIRR